MENRLQSLYNEYIEECAKGASPSCEHQRYMKNLAMEMMAIEYLMKSDIAEHVEVQGNNRHDAWHMALETKNEKWLLFLRLKDEIKDAHMDIEAYKCMKEAGSMDAASLFEKLARTRVENAALVNQLYVSVPYTHGTAEEIAKWEAEHAEVIEKHKAYIRALNS